MRRAGKVHWMVPVVAIGVLGILWILFSPKETPLSVGTKFMDALARGDAKTLTDLSYVDEGSKDELQKQWEFTVTYPGKHYFFRWNVKSEIISSDTQALVKMGVDIGRGYEDEFELPMLKQNGHWRVDTYGLSRTLYPGLPRRG